MTSGSLRTDSGSPSAILRPKFSTVTRSAIAHDERHVVLDQQNSDAERAHPHNAVHQAFDLRRIHPGGRLVEHHQRRAHRESPCNLDQPLLFVRQLADQLATQGFQPDETQALPRRAGASLDSSLRARRVLKNTPIQPASTCARQPTSTLSRTVKDLNSRRFWKVRTNPDPRCSRAAMLRWTGPRT